MSTKPVPRTQEPTQDGVNYSQVVESAKFQQLLQEKRAFIIPMSIFFFVFYFTLPVLTAYFPAVNSPAIGSVSWAWLFGFAQFIMTWSFCMMYSRRAKRFDELAEQIKQDIANGGTRS